MKLKPTLSWRLETDEISILFKLLVYLFQAYDDVTEDAVRENLLNFIKQITPVAEIHGIFLAIHPDDPPISLLGLPRIVSTDSDVRKILGNNRNR